MRHPQHIIMRHPPLTMKTPRLTMETRLTIIRHRRGWAIDSRCIRRIRRRRIRRMEREGYFQPQSLSPNCTFKCLLVIVMNIAIGCLFPKRIYFKVAVVTSKDDMPWQRITLRELCVKSDFAARCDLLEAMLSASQQIDVNRTMIPWKRASS